MAEGNRISIIDHQNYANISVDFFRPYFFSFRLLKKKGNRMVPVVMLALLLSFVVDSFLSSWSSYGDVPF